jgi:hypothetical protein
MDIKNILGPILNPGVRNQKTQATEKTLKMGSTTDRDANGQMFQDRKEDQKPPMTREQLERAAEHIRELPGVKEHQLKVELVVQNDKNYILLTEPNGNVLRRIPEIELWSLPVINSTSPDKKGQILRKSA